MKLLVLVSALVLLNAAALPGAAHIQPELLAGRAAVALASLTGGPMPTALGLMDTGEVASDDATTVERSAARTTVPMASASLLAASVNIDDRREDPTDKFRGFVTSEAHAAVARVEAPPASAGGVSVAGPVQTIEARALRAVSESSCAGASGGSEVGFLAVAGAVAVAQAVSAAPNTVLSLPNGATVILNEQRPVAGADAGLAVNAVHVIVPGTLDVVLASASSAVFACER